MTRLTPHRYVDELNLIKTMFHQPDAIEIGNPCRNCRPAIALLSMALATCLTTPTTYATTFYVDNQLHSDCEKKYVVSTRVCGKGKEIAYRSIASALAKAHPGDTVVLRGGNYRERLIPPRSGSENAPITVKRHGSEEPVLGGQDEPAILISGRSYIVIDGLTVNGALGWGRLEDSKNNIIQNNRFVRATAKGTTGGLKLVRSSQNRITRNSFVDGNDNVVIQESDRNVLSNNTFSRGRHSLLSVRCGNFNVIRGNTFHNPDQKAVEIYDCEGTSDAPVKLDATKRNLFEENRFTQTRASSSDHKYNAIQYAGQNGIVRRNIFHDNQGGGINLQVYSDEALYNYGHRIYNNTFVNNRCYGLIASGSKTSTRYYDNFAKNNIFYRNTNCDGKDSQVNVRNILSVSMVNNALLDVSPAFTNESEHDFRLMRGSAMIDAGKFVTQTDGAGSGTRMIVDDPAYFYDGNGIHGEAGDLIQLSDQTQTARVVAIDYPNRTLVLSEPLSWQDGVGVHLAYTGTRPDMGAHEFTP